MKVVKNWQLISEKTEFAVNELNKGRCARSGYVFGKMIKEIMNSDASLSDALSVSADVAYK